MVKTVRSPYSSAQMAVWLRGLMTIAWSDGQLDEAEQRLIADLMQITGLMQTEPDLAVCEPITGAELAAGLGRDAEVAENFLRTSVLVAIADGTYSPCEADVIRQFGDALGLAPVVIETLNATIAQAEPKPQPVAGGPSAFVISGERSSSALPPRHAPEFYLAPLRSVQDWLEQVDVSDPRLARFLCRLIPAQCPFERDLNLFGRTIAHIPPMCKLNPLYEQLVGLRFRSLSYLADECHEDVTPYC